MRQLVDDDLAVSWSLREQEAYLLRKAGQLDEALAAIEDLNAEAKGNTGAILSLKGLVLSDLGAGQAALAAFRAAADADGTDAVLVGNVGCQLADLGHRSQAVATIRRALSMDPNLGFLYEYLATVLRQEGNEEGAQRELRRAVVFAQKRIDTAPLDPEGWSHMARLRFRLGEYELADQAEQAAKELSRDEFSAATARQSSPLDSGRSHGKTKSGKVREEPKELAAREAEGHVSPPATFRFGEAGGALGVRPSQSAQRGGASQRVGTRES